MLRGRAATPRETIGVPGFCPLAEAVEGAAALRRARATRPWQPSEREAAEQTHHDPHGYLCMGRTPGHWTMWRVSPIVLSIDCSHLVNCLSFSAALWSPSPRWVHQIKKDRQGLRMGTWVIFMKVLIASWNRTDSISSLGELQQNTLLRQSVALVQEKSKHTFGDLHHRQDNCYLTGN